MSPWSDFIREIASFRTANKLSGGSIEDVERDVQNYLAAEVGGDPAYFATDVKKNSIPLVRESRSHVAHAATAFKAAASGTAILTQWLGSGGQPVLRTLAQNRADVCTGRISGNPCRWNLKPGGFIEKSLAAGAETIKSMLEAKGKIGANVEAEDHLRSCALCWCHLPLKVHVPMNHIIDQTPDDIIQKFKDQADWCWMVTENKPATQPAK